MARALTKKRRTFINEYADSGNATQAALKAYDTDNPRVAEAIGSELLSKPIIQQELRKLGFDSNNAKRVIGEILNNEKADPRARIKAAENVFKVNGDYAPDKTIKLSVNSESSERFKQLAKRLLVLQCDDEKRNDNDNRAT